MSIQKQIKELENVLRFLANDTDVRDRVTLVAAKEVEADYKDRIFADGKDSKGGKIGNYDRKPMYAGKSQLRGLPKGGFAPKGKNGKSTFKNGNKKKTRYLKNGYSEFRKRAGRQNTTVDLNLTGASQQTIQTAVSGDKIVLGFTDPKRLAILEGNERRFGKNIFDLSKAEQDTFEIAAVRETRFVIQQILKG